MNFRVILVCVKQLGDLEVTDVLENWLDKPYTRSKTRNNAKIPENIFLKLSGKDCSKLRRCGRTTDS